jgi:hypothetical protein
MCFSEKSSIVSFSIGIIGALLCISLGTITDKIIGLFLGFVSIMQGIEYLIWSHQKCDNYNRFLSILGMIFNHLQPIILGIIILCINPKNSYKKWILTVMFLYLCVIIPYSMQFIYNKNIQCTIKNELNKHLIWKWNLMSYATFIYITFLITICALFLLGFSQLEYGIYAVIAAIISYLTSLLFYHTNVVGALWCYYVAFLPIIYFFMRITFFT